MSELFTKKLNRRRLVQTGAAAGAFAAAHRFNIVSAQGAQKVTALMWSNSPTIDENFNPSPVSVTTPTMMPADAQVVAALSAPMEPSASARLSARART